MIIEYVGRLLLLLSYDMNDEYDVDRTENKLLLCMINTCISVHNLLYFSLITVIDH